MNAVTLYVILGLCAGDCRHGGADYVVALQMSDLLVYSARGDCESDLKVFDSMVMTDSTGAPLPWRIKHYCARVFFADYAQTERLTDGRVTCSYVTLMPDSVMARTLDPYRTQTGAHACKPPTQGK